MDARREAAGRALARALAVTAKKKESGQDGRIRRRKAREQARQNEQARKGGRPKLSKLDDPAHVHLWLIEAGAQRLREIREDPHLTAEERWRFENETTKALAGIQTKADLERKVAELTETIHAAQDELERERAALAREREERRQLPGGAA